MNKAFISKLKDIKSCGFKVYVYTELDLRPVRGWWSEKANVVVMIASLSLTMSHSIAIVDSDRRRSSMLVVVM